MNDLDTLFKNKLFWAIVVVATLMIGVVGVKTILVEKIADRVIEKLQKGYAPGPYAPGFDPDRVNPNTLRPQK